MKKKERKKYVRPSREYEYIYLRNFVIIFKSYKQVQYRKREKLSTGKQKWDEGKTKRSVRRILQTLKGLDDYELQEAEEVD